MRKDKRLKYEFRQDNILESNPSFLFFCPTYGGHDQNLLTSEKLTSASELLLPRGSWGAVNLQVIVKAKPHRPLKIAKITHI